MATRFFSFFFLRRILCFSSRAGSAFFAKAERLATSFVNALIQWLCFVLQLFSAPMEQILQRLQAFGEFEVGECSIFLFRRSGYVVIDFDLACS